MNTLRENWKFFTGVIIFILIYWIFPSFQEKYYLERDLIQFSFNETLIITGIVSLISWIVFYLFFYDIKDRFIRIAQSFAQSIFIGFIYAFVIQSIVIAMGLFINRLSDQGEVTEKFEITYVMKDGELGISSLENTYFDKIENKFLKSALETIKEGDVVQLVFKEGILGKKYLDSGLIQIVE